MKEFHEHSHPSVTEAMKNDEIEARPFRIHRETFERVPRTSSVRSPIETLEPPQRVSNNREMHSFVPNGDLCW